jgi:hypothetical protein
MLATRPTTAAGATALIGAFLQYERALGTELENVAPLLQSLLAFLEGCEAAKLGRHRNAQPAAKRNGRHRKLVSLGNVPFRQRLSPFGT